MQEFDETGQFKTSKPTARVGGSTIMYWTSDLILFTDQVHASGEWWSASWLV